MNTIELQLLAIDFKDTSFCLIPCAIEKAVKRQLQKDSMELLDELNIEGENYLHERYSNYAFDLDQSLANMLEPNQIIRTITLTKVQNV